MLSPQKINVPDLDKMFGSAAVAIKNDKFTFNNF